MISISEAQEIVSKITVKAETEKVNVSEGLGRVLACDIIADIDQPPFNKSAMDGYACKRADLNSELTCLGEIAAGSNTHFIVNKGQCCRIFTGAPVPKGADCVIMQEYTRIETNGKIRFGGSDTKDNICFRGEDIKAGEVAIPTGTLIKSQHLAIMAAFGFTTAEVYCKPKVAVMCSGSELVEPHVTPQEAQIRNSNANQLIAQIHEAGAIADYLGIITDTEEAIEQAINNTVNKYQLIIVTGGASVGDYDLIPHILRNIGASIHFHALNIQPGKPLIYATHKNTAILGLSGNPVSSFLQFILIAKPILYKLLNKTDKYHQLISVKLSETIKRKKGNRQLYVPVTVNINGEAVPVKFNGSAHITGLTEVCGFAILNPDVMEIKAGSNVQLILI